MSLGGEDEGASRVIEDGKVAGEYIWLKVRTEARDMTYPLVT
jgi:hypothetical protein